MNEKIVFPTRLRSDLEKLWEDEGGPAEIAGMDRERFGFEHSCNEFTYDDVEPSLKEFNPDRQSCREHWPWVARAADLYTFEVEERKSYQELGPKEVADLFYRLSDAARSLNVELRRLHTHAAWLSDAKKPEARAHLEYLHELFRQHALADIDGDLVDDVLIHLGTGRMDAMLQHRLTKISKVAREFGANRVDDELLKRSRGQDDPALPGLVFRLGLIWESHTQRRPSANKVHKKGEDRSDFVRFVQSVVDLTKLPRPSPAAIHTALR